MPIFSGVHDQLLQIFNKVCSTLFPAAAGDVMRWIRWILLVLVVIPLILIGCTDLWLHTSLPQTTGALVVSGPSSEIRITRDAVGVPHIVAANDADATFALGFVHAQDRLFQMDMMRRLGAGRLSELFGEGTIGTDRTMRTLGLYRAAERQLAELSAPLRAAFASYAAGVNAFLAQHSTLPVEYALLSAAPEEWRPADSLVWGKYMALLLSGNYRGELVHAKLAARLTPEQLTQLYPAYPSDAPVALGSLAALYRALPLDRIYAALPDAVGPTFASNNWVVDGKHTVSGKPLLANDPHLDFATPDIWYLARLDTPDLHLAGATSPGAPFIVIGHNQRIGWGFTTTEGDVEDLFIERIDPADPNRYLAPAALAPGGSLPFETRQEVIGVRGDKPITMTIRATRHGPVISDLSTPPGAAPAGEILALQATFLAGEDRTPQALWQINRAQNWTEFNAALENMVAPQQNIVYADVDGNIGFTASARIPIRGRGDGWLPVPGWTGEFDWTGFIPFAALPRALNPPEGRFVSANNKIVPDSYPYFIGRDWDIPNRAERINALLDATPLQSPDASAVIQADTLSLTAQRLLPLMLGATPAENRTAAALARLKDWDARMTADEVAPLIFTAWLRDFNRVLFAERLGSSFADYWDLHPPVIEAILTKHPEWCSDPAQPGTTGCAARLALSLRHALDQLTADYGTDMAQWRWGRAHAASFPHMLLSRVPLLRNRFEIAIPADGGADTVNRGGILIQSADQPYLDRHGAGLRMILDFADLDAARYIVVPGQSGNPVSPHYSDLLTSWRQFSWLHVARETTGDTLVLEPQQ
jgi:penicillin amidase